MLALFSYPMKVVFYKKPLLLNYLPTLLTIRKLLIKALKIAVKEEEVTMEIVEELD